MALRLALDTNRYVDMCRGEEGVAEPLEHAEFIYMPSVVMAELQTGFAVGARGPENERVLRRFMMKDGVQIVYPDAQTTRHYASVARQLRTQDTPIPTNHIWIAALVLQHDLALYARDPHFDHLPQLVRV